jgi:hypothetical protein
MRPPLLPEGIAYLALRHTVGDWRDGATRITAGSGGPAGKEAVHGSA